MIPQKRFKLTRQAMLLATISAAFPVTAYCSAGRVDFAIGNVESIAANGSRHPLGKGAEINTGETVSTATGSRAQIRFADGGFISLQPNTQFRVDEFNYKNKTDGEEKGFFSLLKGGFRAITGAIGHVNKQTYRVKTSAATLGIRGTGYNMALQNEGLFVNVGEGAISLSNNAGLLVVTAGRAAFAKNANTAPILTTALPRTPPNGLDEPVFAVAEQLNGSGNPTFIPVMVSGPGYALASAYQASNIGTGASVLSGVTTTLGGASQLLQYNAGVFTAAQSGALGAATPTYSSDGIIGWGRWDGSTTGTGIGPNPMTSAGIFHYVIGIPTAAMPTTGTALFTLLGYTTPTDTKGTPNYTLSGSLNVNFAATTNQVGVNMTVTNSLTNIYVVNGSATIGGSNFNGSINVPMAVGASVCTGSCTASINGFFAGTNASRAGLSYTINDPYGGNNVQGVAAFTR